MTNEMSRPGKCARTGCRRRSVRPRQDGWIYVEFPADLSLKTGSEQHVAGGPDVALHGVWRAQLQPL